MPKVVGIKFLKGNKIYSFDPQELELLIDDGVIVETVKGLEFGRVAAEIKEVAEEELPAPLKPVLRKAGEKDYAVLERHAQNKPGASKTFEEKVAKHKLEMKLVDVEYAFDGSKVIFYFSADSRVDFRDLVKDLASHFRMRIELRQIGIRDECKMLGGIAQCGRPCCCSSHLSDFAHVSVRMAKNQGLSLNPTKISGLCGRLMCCLQYENAHYVQTAKKMPKLGSEVATPDGRGIVVNNNMLKEIVRVRVPIKDGFEMRDYNLAAIQAKETVADELANDRTPDTDILSGE